jgi:hypothetical protein
MCSHLSRKSAELFAACLWEGRSATEEVCSCARVFSLSGVQLALKLPLLKKVHLAGQHGFRGVA